MTTLKLRIEQDENPANPREEFDHFGTMACFHRRYHLGDKPFNNSPDDFETFWTENGAGGIKLPLYLYDHSGLTISTKPFSCPWDSGQIGYIYATKEQIQKEFEGNIEKATKCLESEVVEYNQYLTGDVWGYVVEDEDGHHLDSCWGFYGREYAEEQGNEALNYANENCRAEANLI